LGFDDLVARVDSAVRAHLGSVEVTYTPAVGAAATLDGLFDANYVLVQRDDDRGSVETTAPAVWVKVADLPVHPDADNPDVATVVIAGVSYRVRERKPDGMGHMVLVLRRVIPAGP
jgi:hypothetical protein